MRNLYLLCLFTLTLTSIKAQDDVANSKDYPILDRLPDYSITRYIESEFDAHEFYYENKKNSIEGRKFVIEYQHNAWAERAYKFPTRLQILRNYSNAIVEAGGRILFERYNAEHGSYNFKTSAGKETWVMVKTKLTGNGYTLIVIEQEKMRQDITIDAELISNTIDREGKIALYGIYFDTGASTIKEASEAALLEIAKYLKGNPTINCWVVGHTDSDGSAELNRKLSLARAIAIKDRLQLKHGIAETRLFAEGVGPLSPVATNATEAGKKLNRRVELVKK